MNVVGKGIALALIVVTAGGCEPLAVASIVTNVASLAVTGGKGVDRSKQVGPYAQKAPGQELMPQIAEATAQGVQAVCEAQLEKELEKTQSVDDGNDGGRDCRLRPVCLPGQSRPQTLLLCKSMSE